MRQIEFSNLEIHKYEITEAVFQRSSVKNVFLKILRNWQENTCAIVSFPVSFAKFLRTSFLTEHLWWLRLRLESFVSSLYEKQDGMTGWIFPYVC